MLEKKAKYVFWKSKNIQIKQSILHLKWPSCAAINLANIPVIAISLYRSSPIEFLPLFAQCCAWGIPNWGAIQKKHSARDNPTDHNPACLDQDFLVANSYVLQNWEHFLRAIFARVWICEQGLNLVKRSSPPWIVYQSMVELRLVRQFLHNFKTSEEFY